MTEYRLAVEISTSPLPLDRAKSLQKSLRVNNSANASPTLLPCLLPECVNLTRSLLARRLRGGLKIFGNSCASKLSARPTGQTEGLRGGPRFVASLHSARSERRKHHEIEWFSYTTMGSTRGYHDCGNSELPGAKDNWMQKHKMKAHGEYEAGQRCLESCRRREWLKRSRIVE